MAKQEAHQLGYDHEEAYFYKVNQELIERKRRELGERNPTLSCPKCSSKMTEIVMSRIHVDQCTGCKGIFFDQGELQTLLDSQEPKGFLSLMRRRLLS